MGHPERQKRRQLRPPESKAAATKPARRSLLEDHRHPTSLKTNFMRYEKQKGEA
jgi:hypothetical protein